MTPAVIGSLREGALACAAALRERIGATRCILTVAASLALAAGVSGAHAQEGRAMALTITSTAFAPNGAIPVLYTCKGKDISPPLAWAGVPAGAKSLALIVDDPDAPDPAAPTMTWVHWVLYDMPVTATGLGEAAKPAALPAGTHEGTNDFGRTAYGGPCPPIGLHRYFFKLYALDTVLPDLKRPSKAALEKAMHGHILAQATLVGTHAAAR